MQSPEVWSDKNLASKLGTEIKELKDHIERIEKWFTIIEDAQVAIDIEDKDLIQESFSLVQETEKEIDSFELRLMLSGEYDTADAILTVNAGAGGTDAQDWASLLLRMYTRWAEKRGWKRLSAEAAQCLPVHG